MDAKTSLKGRSFLTLKDLHQKKLVIFRLAAKLKADKKKRDHRKQSKKGKNIALLFEKTKVQEQDVHLRSDVLMRCTPRISRKR